MTTASRRSLARRRRPVSAVHPPAAAPWRCLEAVETAVPLTGVAVRSVRTACRPEPRAVAVRALRTGLLTSACGAGRARQRAGPGHPGSCCKQPIDQRPTALSRQPHDVHSPLWLSARSDLHLFTAHKSKGWQELSTRRGRQSRSEEAEPLLPRVPSGVRRCSSRAGALANRRSRSFW